MAAYVEWLLTPEGEREPSTKTAFAESRGVTLQSLRNYTREPWFQREMAERARAIARIDRLPKVLDNLYKIATSHPLDGTPSAAAVSAAKTLLDWADKTSSVRENPVDLEGLTEPDLVQLAMELLQRSNDGSSSN